MWHCSVSTLHARIHKKSHKDGDPRCSPGKRKRKRKSKETMKRKKKEIVLCLCFTLFCLLNTGSRSSKEKKCTRQYSLPGELRSSRVDAFTRHSKGKAAVWIIRWGSLVRQDMTNSHQLICSMSVRSEPTNSGYRVWCCNCSSSASL